MPARKIAVRPPNAKNNGKSANGKYMDDHPELQTGYWKNQVMTYDSAVAMAMKIGIWDIALAQLINIVEINGFIRLLSRYAVIEYAEALFIQLIEKNYV